MSWDAVRYPANPALSAARSPPWAVPCGRQLEGEGLCALTHAEMFAESTRETTSSGSANRVKQNSTPASLLLSCQLSDASVLGGQVSLNRKEHI